MPGDDHSPARAWQVRLGPDGPAFAAREDQSLLQAAEAAGWPLPSSCRNGTCRTCLQRLRSGQVHYRIDWPGVSAPERAEGWILPCVAHAAGDLVLDDPWAHSLPVT
ncbi:MAG: 2Fe-2S iron-sulfur cluster binding domain-containing protein [Comamonadaceae bacterium]|nr:MAG: 2Fe-2S iron-sulfur cluster binding domain-containing protein [Comamonadaceae bacterium]